MWDDRFWLPFLRHLQLTYLDIAELRVRLPRPSDSSSSQLAFMDVEQLEGTLAVELMSNASRKHRISFSAKVITALNSAEESHLSGLLHLYFCTIVAERQRAQVLSAPVPPWVFYCDRNLHVRPCPAIISGDSDLELRRAMKLQILKALRVKYPHQLKGLVFGDNNGPLLLAWQLVKPTTSAAPAALYPNLASETRKLDPSAPSFRPLRQAFKILINRSQWNDRGSNDLRRAASAVASRTRGASNQSMSASGGAQNNVSYPSTPWSPHCPPIASVHSKSRSNSLTFYPSYPFWGYGSLLHVNRNVPDQDLRGEITGWQQELERIGQVTPRPEDHMSNLKQRINRLQQVLETKKDERQQG